MKNIFKYFIITCFIGIMSGCEDYLSVPPDATLNEETIFTSYKPFQGFIDNCYSMIIDCNDLQLGITNNIGTEAMSHSTGNVSYGAMTNQWFRIGTARSIWVGSYDSEKPDSDATRRGLYYWWTYGSRIANISLDNLPLLADATDEQKKAIEGQALFFRAYLHFEVVRAYGSIPYLDKVLGSTNAQMPRYWTDEESGKKDCQAVFEKAARDLRKAADLLPVSWSDAELGRITKGAALGLLAKVYLFAGSPLFEEAAAKGNSAITPGQTAYNTVYMQKAAETAAELINMNVYSLPAWGSNDPTNEFAGEGYRRTFTTIDGNIPYSSETILQRWNSLASPGMNTLRDRLGRHYMGQSELNPGGAGAHEAPLLGYMDKFEMKDGSQYKPGNAINGGYDDDINKFANQRDPRFQHDFWTHNEKIGLFTAKFNNKGRIYAPATLAPFCVTKFWYPAQDVNNLSPNLMYRTPNIRYAEILLIYAEAAFEATGNPDASIGTAKTARQALNEVRNRAFMPNYNPASYSVARTTHGELSSDDPFRLAVWNERAVELCYEGHYWFDLRRWKRIHLLEDKLWSLDFDQNWTTVSRYVVSPFVYEMRNYWLPFPTSHTQIFEGYSQNPGW